VFHNGLDHRQPIDGDHGLRWDAVTGEEFPEYAFVPTPAGLDREQRKEYQAYQLHLRLLADSAQRKAEPEALRSADAGNRRHRSAHSE
jgi:hypothetical protein